MQQSKFLPGDLVRDAHGQEYIYVSDHDLKQAYVRKPLYDDRILVGLPLEHVKGEPLRKRKRKAVKLKPEPVYSYPYKK